MRPSTKPADLDPEDDETSTWGPISGPTPRLPNTSRLELWEKQIAWAVAARYRNSQAAGLLVVSIEGAIRQVVFSRVRMMAGSVLPLTEEDGEDMVGEARILVLARAIPRFDASRGVRFLTYALPWIRFAARRWVQDHGRTVRIPVGQIDSRNTITRVGAALHKSLGRRATDQEIADAAGVTTRRVENAHRIFVVPRSLDEPAMRSNDKPDGRTLGESIPDQAPNAEEALCQESDEMVVLRQELARLGPREQQVLRLRFWGKDGTGSSLRESGLAMGGVTRERARQIETKAKDELMRRLLRRNFSRDDGLLRASA